MYAIQSTENPLIFAVENGYVAAFTNKNTAEKFRQSFCYCLPENLAKWGVVDFSALLTALDIQVYTG